MITPSIWTYSLISVAAISLISLIGVVTIAIKREYVERFVFYLVSFAAGALFGDVFIHLMPEISRQYGFGIQISAAALLGIVFSFVIEKIIHWRHYHATIQRRKHAPFALMSLLGDSVHNFIDGLIIGVSYVTSIPLGIASTLAIALHEIPQEIGDFGVLIHGGISRRRAIYYNFGVSLTAVAGTIIALTIGAQISVATPYLLSFAAGTFLYIAGSDLIPELHKEVELKKSIIQFLAFIAGIAIMFTLLLVE